MQFKKVIIVLWFLSFLTGIALGQNTLPKAGNEAMIEQLGIFNEGYIDQTGSNFASVEQTGNSNRALVQQGMGSSPDSDSDMPVDTSFPGDGGRIGHILSASSADIVQNGVFNDAFVVQLGSHSAEINQLGGNNQAGIIQLGTDIGPYTWLPGDGDSGSIASIIQNGSYNEAIIGQLGSSHNGIIEQYGNNNRATIAQMPFSGMMGGDFPSLELPGFGDFNGGSTGTIIQHGDWNKAAIIQGGENIPIEIIQYGHESAIMVEHNGIYN